MSTPTSPLRSICLQHLDGLKHTFGELLRMAVVSSTDGFPIAMLDIEASAGRKATAMAAALDGLCKTIVKEFALGALEGTVLECEQGLVLCRQVRGPNRNLVLLLVLGEGASYGHALWAVKNAVQEIGASLQDLLDTNTSPNTTIKD
ncbi:roadblock/LC7 domain-containing protein [Pseudomonas sp. LRF_L74]|uniref:roadblock/LC7 domain-containing protein n=1 Tax=Pseudomonas sp. LRF_L74 TaxID=3369422 RepID=UPI003F6127D7